MQEITGPFNLYSCRFMDDPALPLSTWRVTGTGWDVLVLACGVGRLLWCVRRYYFREYSLNDRRWLPPGAATGSEIAAQRARFEGPWNALNTSDVASVLSILLVTFACLSRTEK